MCLLNGYYNRVLTLYKGEKASFTHPFISFDQTFFSGEFIVKRIEGRTLQDFRGEVKSRKYKNSYLIVIKASNLYFK